eukprot:jgi/Mesvir1/16133/Mv08410-RA.4
MLSPLLSLLLLSPSPAGCLVGHLKPSWATDPPAVSCGERAHVFAADSKELAARWVATLSSAWRHYVEVAKRKSSTSLELDEHQRMKVQAYEAEAMDLRARLKWTEGELVRRDQEWWAHWLAHQEKLAQAERQRASMTRYRIEVHTGARRGAGTTSRVSLVIGGSRGDSGTISLDRESWRPASTAARRPLQRGAVDLFEVTCPSMGEMETLRVWHDNTGSSPGWFCDKIKVWVVSTPGEIGNVKASTAEAMSPRKDDKPTGAKEAVFPCWNWLATDEGDGLTVRELQRSSRGDGRGQGRVCTYQVTTHTSDMRGAATSANVWVRMLGERGQSPWLALESSPHNFERGRMDAFLIETKDVGSISEIEIGTDGSGLSPQWHLDFVEVAARDVRASTAGGVAAPSTAYFPCYQWVGPGADKDAPKTDGEPPPAPVASPSQAHSMDAGAVGAHGDVASKKSPVVFSTRLLAVVKDPRSVLVTYIVTTHTSNLRGAATDSNLFLQLQGDRAASDTLPLRGGIKAFERGKADTFAFTMADLGDLESLRVGTEANGANASWHVDMVEVAKLPAGSGTPAGGQVTGHVDLAAATGRWYFPCGFWLNPKRLVQEVEASMKDPRTSRVKYKVVFYTGHMKGAGTDANISIRLYGERGHSSERRLESAPESFERGCVDTFTLESPNLGGLEMLRVSHDSKGDSPGWFLDHVEVTDPVAGTRYLFPCGQWLDNSVGDRATTRELRAVREKNEEASSVRYAAVVRTGDLRGAGTDGNVFLTLHGSKEDSAEIKLENAPDNFSRGKEDRFEFTCANLGKIKSVTLRHDGSGDGTWYLAGIDIIKVHTEDTVRFPCPGVWLERKRGSEGQLSLTLYPEGSAKALGGSAARHNYKVLVTTSDLRGAATDANVSITLYGSNGRKEGPLPLESAKNNFERGQVDEFYLTLPDLGPLEKINIGHDNSGHGASWHCAKVEVVDVTAGRSLEFPCNQWFDKNEGDGLIRRDLLPGGKGQSRGALSRYRVLVATSDIKGAGTDANVSIKLFGSNGETPSIRLSSSKDDFERGNVDEFFFTSPDIGPVERILIGHDSKGVGASWHLDHVKVVNESSGSSHLFPCGEWLDKVRPSRELSAATDGQAGENAIIAYTAVVRTGNVRGAGTNGNVFMMVRGSNRESGQIRLESGPDNFSRGKEDRFEFTCANLGEIKSVSFRHDGSGDGSWYLAGADIINNKTKESVHFPCPGQWLALQKSGEGQLTATLYPEGSGDAMASSVSMRQYKVTVYTSDVRGASTDANMSISFQGANGRRQGPYPLESAKDNFERGKVDEFLLAMPELGDIEKVIIGHDNAGYSPSWHCAKVEVTDLDTGKQVEFPSHAWFSKQEGDGLIRRELLAAGKDPNLKRRMPARYRIVVATSDLRGAGTDANVSIKLFGLEGETHSIHLSSSKDDFERGHVDEFFASAPDIGALTRVIIGHDGKGAGASWHLDYVKVVNETAGAEYMFPCGEWLEEGRLSRELLPLPASQLADRTPVRYLAVVRTSDLRGAGTASNVFLLVRGSKRDMPEIKLESGRDNFMRGKEDRFAFKCPNLGDIKSITLRHDGSADGSWHLAGVEIINQDTQQVVRFYCPGLWLERGPRGDVALSTTLYPEGSAEAKALAPPPTQQYKVTVRTTDVSGGGTDARVEITLVGAHASSGPHALEAVSKDTFERGQRDVFYVTAASDLGPIERIRIGHDNSGDGPAWHLADVTVEDMGTGTVATFPCNLWLAKNQGDGLIVRELKAAPPGPEGGSKAGKAGKSSSSAGARYKVTVRTTDVSGGGTDARVEITLVGARASSGPHALEAVSKDTFERGQRDVFYVTAASDLGPIERIRIGHDNSGDGPAWHLADVTVEDTSSGAVATFPCHTWLAKNQGDGLIVRELKAASPSRWVTLWEVKCLRPPLGSCLSLLTDNRRGHLAVAWGAWRASFCVARA